MAIQSFSVGQVLTAAQVNALQANDYNQTVSNKTASYTLVAADKGTRIAMSSTSATTITVNTSLFSAGDTLFIQNLNTGICTITAGTATVTTSASLALAQWEGGTLYFTSASAAIFIKGAGAAAASGGMTLLSTTTLSGATTNITGIDQSYVNLFILITGATNATADGLLYCRPDGSSNNAITYIYNSTVSSTTGDWPLTGGSNTTFNDANNAFAINIFNYSSTTTYKPISWDGYYQLSGGSRYVTGGGGSYFNSAVDSFLVYASGGNLNGGTVRIYGVK